MDYTAAIKNLFDSFTWSYTKEQCPEMYRYKTEKWKDVLEKIQLFEDQATEEEIPENMILYLLDYITSNEQIESFINECIELTSLFVDSILTAIGTDNDVNEAITSTYIDNTSIFSKVFSIINLFKSYTTQFSNTDVTYTINNSKDCLVKVFDMLKAHVGGDKLTESIYELIYHQITGGGSGTADYIKVWDNASGESKNYYLYYVKN